MRFATSRGQGGAGQICYSATGLGGAQETNVAQIDRPNGIVLELPDEVTILEPPTGPRRRGDPLDPSGPTGSSLGDIAAALYGFEVLDTFALAPAPAGPGGRRRRRGPDRTERATVTVGLPPDDSAVVLIDEDGFFSWRFPTETVAAGPASRRRGAPAGATKELRFEFEFGETQLAPSGRRGIPILGRAIEKVTATVLRFALPPVVGAAVEYMERNRHTGLVHISSADPHAWTAAPVPPAIAGRRSKALLLIHGTFSSTRGGFGALGGTPWGKQLLDEAVAHYDIVLGYDHKTLSVDPNENARGLLKELRALWPSGEVDFDVLSHSRGGLVYRSLVEQVLPAEPWPGTFNRAVFVAAANSGTELANAENWERLADLYTNLAAMASRGLAIIVPGAGVASLVLAEVLDGVGTLVKTIVTGSLVDEGIPGLAAMQPKGKFITGMNASALGQPTPEGCSYFGITSNFKAGLRTPDSELPERLLSLLKDGLVDQLMRADNDMVVDLSSMTTIDPTAGDFFDEKLDFGENGVVYHTNYFHQPQTGRVIGQWLGLGADVSAQPRRRSSRRIVPPMPTGATTDFRVIDAMESFNNALIDQLNSHSSAYVVIEKYSDVRYAFRRDELFERFEAADQRGMAGDAIGRALDLHEDDRSTLKREGEVIALGRTDGPSTARRSIVLSGETTMAVVVPPQDAMTAGQLGSLASHEPLPHLRGLAESAPPVADREEPAMGNGHGGAPVAERPRRRTRSSRRVPTGPEAPPPAEPEPVTVNVGAWTDAELEIEQPATLTVSLARGEVVAPSGTAASFASLSSADPSKLLIVMVVGRRNVRVTGKTTQTVPVPGPNDDPVELYFDILGTTLGEAQIDVIIRQSEAPMAKIKLLSQVVTTVSGGRRTEGQVSASPAADPGPPRHQLYINEVQHGSETSYHFHLELLRPGEPPQPIEAESKPLAGDKADYVRGLYKRIEDMWGETRDQVARFADQVRAEGGTLWDDLIPRSIQAQLWENRDEIRFIQVYSDEPFIPWELVHMKEPGKRQLPTESWFLAELGLIRWIMPADETGGCNRAPRNLRVRPGKVRALVPEYAAGSGWELESAPSEISTLEGLFGAVERIQPEFGAIKSCLAQGDFDILHYAGHGTGDSDRIGDEALVLDVERGAGGWQPGGSFRAADVVSHAILSETPCAEHRPIVLLNCCETGRSGYTLTSIGGLASAFVGAGAGVLISPLWSVDDVAAADFSRAFYGSLKSGATLAEAARAARAAIKAFGDQTWLAYTVYGEPTARLS